MEDTGCEMTDSTRLLGPTCQAARDTGQGDPGYHSLDGPRDTESQGNSDTSKSYKHRCVIGYTSKSTNTYNHFLVKSLYLYLTHYRVLSPISVRLI